MARSKNRRIPPEQSRFDLDEPAAISYGHGNSDNKRDGEKAENAAVADGERALKRNAQASAHEKAVTVPAVDPEISCWLDALADIVATILTRSRQETRRRNE
ncbi:MAG: hypothetical protein HYX88_02265 [Chloroflexi bacterium]|nr:hypothetical protein [Chloroflexota bacterium]